MCTYGLHTPEAGVEEEGTDAAVTRRSRVANQNNAVKDQHSRQGVMPQLERNYLDKHDALNRTASALTEKGLSFIAAKNLHR